MSLVKKIDDCFAYRNQCNGNVGFVPTMGALHAGHLELVKQSLATCNITIVSIFLNPKQFSSNEDLDKYPVNLKRDLSLLENLNVDCVFTPDTSEIYTQDHSIVLIENQLSKVLEGKSRPGFFQGVITVVAKLFNICNPTHVFFGQKDAQQLVIIEKPEEKSGFQQNPQKASGIAWRLLWGALGRPSGSLGKPLGRPWEASGAPRGRLGGSLGTP